MNRYAGQKYRYFLVIEALMVGTTELLRCDGPKISIALQYPPPSTAAKAGNATLAVGSLLMAGWFGAYCSTASTRVDSLRCAGYSVLDVITCFQAIRDCQAPSPPSETERAMWGAVGAGAALGALSTGKELCRVYKETDVQSGAALGLQALLLSALLHRSIHKVYEPSRESVVNRAEESAVVDTVLSLL